MSSSCSTTTRSASTSPSSSPPGSSSKRSPPVVAMVGHGCCTGCSPGSRGNGERSVRMNGSAGCSSTSSAPASIPKRSVVALRASSESRSRPVTRSPTLRPRWHDRASTRRWAPQRGGAEVVLRRCPFASAALADRHTVCALHLGIAEGLVEGGAVSIDELVAYDPRKADCRLRLHVTREEPAPHEARGTLTLRGRRPTR